MSRQLMTEQVSTILARKGIRHVIESAGDLLQVDVVDPGSQALQDGDLATLFRSRRLTRARRARLKESYLVIVSFGVNVAAVAACKPVNGNVWAVHDFAFRSRLSSERNRLLDLAMDALEATCLARGTCAIVVLRTDISPAVFKRRGYVVIIERCGGAWLQKHLLPSAPTRSPTVRVE